MSRQENIRALISDARRRITALRPTYDRYLEAQTVPVEVSIEVKGILENLRSPLDYLARDIWDKCIGGEPHNRLYFPIGIRSEADFVGRVGRDFPDLAAKSVTVYTALDALQMYRPTGRRALPMLSELVNANKHNDLTPQTRKESRGLEIRFPGGAGISMGPGCSISGGGIISSGGAWISPAGGVISGDSPARVGQGVEQTVTRWVSFHFPDGNEVLSLLNDCLLDVEHVVTVISPHIW